MLLNNFRPDKDDRFYFLFRFAVRSWIMFLAVLFSVPVGAIAGRPISGEKFLTMCGAFVFIVVVDFVSVWIKAYREYKEMARIKREMFGSRKFR